MLQIARSYVPGGLGGWVIWNKRSPLAPLEDTIEADERIDAKGDVLVPLDEARHPRATSSKLRDRGHRGADHRALQRLRQRRARAPHRRRSPQEIAPHIPVSTSAAIMPEMYEYERTETTVVNSYVRPVVSKYVANLQRELKAKHGRARNLQILRSDGGLSSAQAAMDQPVNLLMSGPAGGVSGALWIAKQAKLQEPPDLRHGRHLDRRGADRERRSPAPAARPASADVTVRAPSIDVRTVGAGGGSIAYVPELTKALRVGPKSAGAVPGPAAYDKGGELPTVTDANVVLGYLPSDAKLGGDMDDPPRPRRARRCRRSPTRSAISRRGCGRRHRRASSTRTCAARCAWSRSSRATTRATSR